MKDSDILRAAADIVKDFPAPEANSQSVWLRKWADFLDSVGVAEESDAESS